MIEILILLACRVLTTIILWFAGLQTWVATQNMVENSLNIIANMSESKKELISIREFGRRMGVSDTSVHKAIEAVKIQKGLITDDKGKKKIDFEVAKAEWIANGGPLQIIARTNTVNSKITTDVNETNLEQKNSVAGKQTSLDDELKKAPSNFTEANTQKIIAESEMKKMELEEMKGKLVSKENVYKTLYKLGQKIRTDFEAIPDRIIDNLMACKDRHEAHTMLSDAIRDSLKAISEITPENLTK